MVLMLNVPGVERELCVNVSEDTLAVHTGRVVLVVIQNKHVRNKKNSSKLESLDNFYV